MALPKQFTGKLALPVVSAPMFLASTPQMVVASCIEGIIGTFPAANQRTSEGLERWVIDIKQSLIAYEIASGKQAAPFGVNVIVHKTNPRVKADLALLVKHKVPLLITSLGAVSDVVDAVHSYGGVVFHDVINARHGRKAMQAGVDGLIAVAAGAGGHAGTLHPFALIQELRQFFDKTIILSGAISTGAEIAAALCLGADLAYMGTRFLATQECQIANEYKQLLIESSAEDIIYTNAISGIPASFVKKSIENAGYDLNNLPIPDGFDIGAEMSDDNKHHENATVTAKPWKDIWSAGQGVSAIKHVISIKELINQLSEEFELAMLKVKVKS
ncbi:NAD(P)H-dependent flavin oxidoreductase [Colwellia sp. 12G3]|uniref:NAD(P)H-dependent flavin oxidoreductase n=1 Tax=Colwellia sp. 12G3 TaxID=2058299 RepID=UPI000C33D6FC|nr:nitronate monooxygenase family protein [Colwellia sp. 12G3]PKI16185.1 nitronate monooxygenase [Colwellia sp. 12G3]